MEDDDSIITSEADEDRVVQRLSVVATFGILVATIAAAIAGSLAALASVHSDDASASRVAWATYSNETMLAYNQYAANQGLNASSAQENAWRVRLLEDLAARATDPEVEGELDAQEFAALGQVKRVPSAPRPSFVSPSPAQWCRQRQSQPYDCAYEVSSAYGSTALADDQQERAYIACVSMLAIALFLFALSKMLNQPSMEKLFIWLGAVMTLIAVGWMVTEPLSTPAPQPSGAAIRSYERGWYLEQLGRPSLAGRVESLLTRATTGDPSLVDAWQELGEEELLYPSPATGTRCQRAISDLTRAWELRGSSDDTDRLAIAEVLCGEPSVAWTTLHEQSADPSRSSAEPAMALTELALGHSRPALGTLDAAVRSMIGESGGVRGPVFVTYWFDQLFAQVSALDRGSDPPPHIKSFIARMQRDEADATLADYGLRLPTAARGAWVHVTVKNAASQLGTASGMDPVTLDFRYSGLRNADVISVMWDQAGTVESDRFVSLALPGVSVLIVGGPGGPPPGSGTFVAPAVDFLLPGNYLIDVSLDATAQSPPITVSVKAPPSSAGPTVPPLTSASSATAATTPTTTSTTTTPTTPSTIPSTTTTSCPNEAVASTTTTTLLGSAAQPPFVSTCGPQSSQ